MSFPRYKWQPTTAEIAAAAGIPEADVERFDHNTSPVPTTWAAAVVAGVSTRLNEYPAASYAVIREAVSGYVGLEPGHIVPGAGADELILLTGRAFLGPGRTALQITPTYPLYSIATAQARAEMVNVASDPPDFGFPSDVATSAARDTDVVYLCIPNNPTGSRPDDATLRDIVSAARGVVVIDAAYAEFAGDDWAPWIGRHDNLIVLHTLSKAFGLAGARVGYALGAPDLIAELDAVRPPGSIASPSVDLAVSALSMSGRMRAGVRDLARTRRELELALDGIGFRVLRSTTNFLLCEVGPTAPALHAALMSEGLVVRAYPAESPLAEYLRFTVRLPDANRRLITALERNSQ
jgi:histidinol-phosphate aminotransferase